MYLNTVSKSPLCLLFDNLSRLRAFRHFLQLSNHVAAPPVSQRSMQNANTRDVYDVFLVSISWMKLEVKNLLPSVSEQDRKIILGEIQSLKRHFKHSGTTLPFQLRMSIDGRKIMATSVGSEASFL